MVHWLFLFDFWFLYVDVKYEIYTTFRWQYIQTTEEYTDHHYETFVSIRCLKRGPNECNVNKYFKLIVLIRGMCVCLWQRRFLEKYVSFKSKSQKKTVASYVNARNEYKHHKQIRFYTHKLFEADNWVLLTLPWTKNDP